MRKTLFIMAFCSLLGALRAVAAEKAAYAVINGTTMTFYYDDQGDQRSGITYYCARIEWMGTTEYSHVKKVVFNSSFAEYRPTSTSRWFYVESPLLSGSALESISGIQYLNTSEVTDMSKMFYNAHKLTSLDLSGFNTSKVTSMYGMFGKCLALKSIKLGSGFNTANVTNMGCMFYGCNALTSLDVSGFNTANVTDMYGMFYGCKSLTTLDVSRFNTAKVTDMANMFRNCNAVKTLDVSRFNTRKVTSMYNMFEGCSSVTALDVSGFLVGGANTLKCMFKNCSSVKTLDLHNFCVASKDSMFYNCSNLVTIYAGDLWKQSTAGKEIYRGCTSLRGGKGTEYNGTYIAYERDHVWRKTSCSPPRA